MDANRNRQMETDKKIKKQTKEEEMINKLKKNETVTDRQTGRQTDRQTHRQTDRQTYIDRQTNKKP